MHNGNKIIASIILICILCPLFVMIPTKTYAYTSEEVGQAIADFARRIIEEGNDDVRGKVLRYSQRHRNSGYNWKLVTDNEPATTTNDEEGEPIPGKLAFDCSSFCSYVYTHVTSGAVKFLESSSYWGNKGENSYFRKISLDEAQPGDVLWKKGHVGIYLGDESVAEAAGFKGKDIDEQVRISGNFYDFTCAYRLKEEFLEKITTLDTVVDWAALGLPNGGIGGNSMAGGLYYQGLANARGNYPENKGYLNMSEISDYIIGFIFMGIKVQLIGWTSIIENLATDIVYTAIGLRNMEDDRLTIEKIIFNKVPILNVNIFDRSLDDDTTITTSDGQEYNVISIIRQSIANIYQIFRNVAIIGLLVVLIYIAIRIGISSIGEQRAKYQKLFINWLVSFIIVFFIHYFILGVILVNQFVVGKIADQMEEEEVVTELRLVDVIDPETGEPVIDEETKQRVQELREVEVTVTKESSLYESVLEKAYDMKATQGIAGTILYMFLVYYMIKFLFIYFKRYFTVNILIVLAPLMAISYGIDKIKDNKSQTLGTWTTELTLNVLMQSMHALLYLIFMGMAFDLAFQESLIGIIIAFVFLNFMAKAEKLLFKFFRKGRGGGKSYPAIRPSADSTDGVIGAYYGVRSAARSVRKGTASVAKGAYGVAKEGLQEIVDTTPDEHGRRTPMGSAVHALWGGAGETPEHKNRRLTRSANIKAGKEKVQKTLKLGGKLASNAVQFGISVPMIIANPKLGFSGLIHSRVELARLAKEIDKLSVSQEKNKKYTKKKGKKSPIDSTREANRLKNRVVEVILQTGRGTTLTMDVVNRSVNTVMQQEGRRFQLRDLDRASEKLDEEFRENNVEINREVLQHNVKQEISNLLVDLVVQDKGEIEEGLRERSPNRNPTVREIKSNEEKVINNLSERQVKNIAYDILKTNGVVTEGKVTRKQIDNEVLKYKQDYGIQEKITTKDFEKIFQNINENSETQINIERAKEEQQKQERKVLQKRRHKNEETYSMLESVKEPEKIQRTVQKISPQAQSVILKTFEKLKTNEINSSDLENIIGKETTEDIQEEVVQNLTAQEISELMFRALKRKGSLKDTLNQE